MNIRAIIFCGALSAAGYVPAAETLTNQFQQALIAEEANQNLTNAISGYEAVIKGLDAQRPLAATAVFRLGECYRKLGRTNDAVQVYQRVITEFSDQDTLVKLSRQNLSILRPTPETGGDEYVIKPNDTLTDIAKAFGSTRQRLLELNPGLDARRLHVGDRIRIRPSTGTSDLTFASAATISGINGETYFLSPEQERDRLRATLDQISKARSEDDKKAIIQLLMPDPQLSNLDEATIKVKQKIASLGIELSPENPMIKAQRAELDSLKNQSAERVASLVNAAQAKLRVLEQITAENSGHSAAVSTLDPAARAKEKALLEQEIALAQEQLKEDQKRVEMGTISTEDSIPHQLDLLELKRKLAALESGSESIARQKEFLDQEIKLVDQLLASAQVRIQNGKGSSSELRDVQRQKLQLQREQIELDRTPATASTTTSPTPAMTAEEAEELRRVQALVANSPDLINRLSGDPSDYPLRRAAENGWVNVVDFLLQHGAKTEVNLNGIAPLQVAAEEGHLAVVESLIRASANLDRHSMGSPTPLLAACQKGYAAVARALIDAGADVNIASGTSLKLYRSGKPPIEYSPLAVADLQISRMLIEHGALLDGAPGSEPPIVRAGTDTDMLDLLLAHHAKPGLTNSVGETALFAAATSSNLTNVTRLLNLGLDPNARDSRGKPVIQNCFFAALDSRYSAEIRDRNWAVVKKLIESGADPNTKLAQIPDQSDPQQTLLHVAAFRGDLRAIQFLLDKGADVNAKAADGHTPLHLAAVANHVDVIKLLLEYHADVNAADQYGDTPLHFAAMARSLEAAKALIDAGANRDAKDKGRYNAMAFAAAGGMYHIDSFGVPSLNGSNNRVPLGGPLVPPVGRESNSDKLSGQNRTEQLQILLSDPTPTNSGKAPAPKGEPQ